MIGVRRIRRIVHRTAARSLGGLYTADFNAFVPFALGFCVIGRKRSLRVMSSDSWISMLFM